MDLKLTNADIRFFRQKLMTWGKLHYKDFLWRNLDNQWHSLVAELMLQRTRAEQVEPIFREFVQNYPNPIDFVRNPVNVFEHLGLPERHTWITALAERLTISSIPSQKENLLDLPGVGDYVASAFRSLHSNLFDRIIDSNVVRFYGRYFGFPTNGETRRKKWFIELAKKLTPLKNHRQFNYALLDFTRMICTPVPHCEICPLQKRCAYFARSQQQG